MPTKVIMKVSIASSNWSYVPQQEVELDDDLAKSWIECGHAVPVGGVVDGSKEIKSDEVSNVRTSKPRGSKKSSETG